MAGTGRWRKAGRASRSGARTRIAITLTVGAGLAALAVVTAWWWSGREKAPDATAGPVGEEAPPSREPAEILARLECPEMGIGPGNSGSELVLDAALRVRAAESPGESPRFRFLPGEAVVVDQVVDDPVFAAVAEVLVRWPESGGAKSFGGVTRVRQTGVGTFEVETSGGVRVLFLARDVERQFRNLERVRRHAEESGKRLAVVNLVPERNLPVRYW